MLTKILIVLGLIAFAYIKRHAFRRAWYILRTGAEKPNWEALGGDYFLAPWERRTIEPDSGEKDGGVERSGLPE